MKRRDLLAGACLAGASGIAKAPRPNILWITCEDLSPLLGCYGDRDARTPNLDQLASESVRYDNAYSTAPVCSPSRSCLITGQ
jgi:N-sulfoglucosamine sulfohydrolase